MKILLLGDSSNYHATLAKGLRAMGHEVVVASDGSTWMDTQRDIDISRRDPGKAAGMALWARMQWMCRWGRMKGYDVVSIHRPTFMSLHPARLAALFDLLRRNNRTVFLTATTADSFYVDECLDPVSPIRYNEYRIYDRPGPACLQLPEQVEQLRGGDTRSLCEHVYGHIDGVVSALWEYHIALMHRLPPSKVAYGDIPIDTNAINFQPMPTNVGKVKMLLGKKSGQGPYKGTELLEAAAKRIVERNPGKLELAIVENRPLKEYLAIQSQAHILLDQALSYSPATNALQAMAMGKVVVSGGEPAYYDFIGEADNRPIINALPDVEALSKAIEEVALHPTKLSELGCRSRDFVVRHNDVSVVAHRFNDFWERIIQGKTRPSASLQ